MANMHEAPLSLTPGDVAELPIEADDVVHVNGMIEQTMLHVNVDDRLSVMILPRLDAHLFDPERPQAGVDELSDRLLDGLWNRIRNRMTG
jgi:hypothetical protein